jgi:hypothetical protein
MVYEGGFWFAQSGPVTPLAFPRRLALLFIFSSHFFDFSPTPASWQKPHTSSLPSFYFDPFSCVGSMSTYPLVPHRAGSSEDLQYQVEYVRASSPYTSFQEKQSSMDPLTLHKRPALPPRRFSGRWFSLKWDRQVVIGFIPRIIYVVLGLGIMAIWVGVVFAFAQRSSKLQEQNAEGKPSHGLIGLNSSTEAVSNYCAFGNSYLDDL